ncbi:MAG: winged helix-turn-helix transcriptional regulator [Allosphingosinicella sp.]|uniref:winged helix-turn-helix transcriptional regulator n=1 Tax=Allosphingosinicella sp. TaxID=2823234 RepID=UPI0039440A9F
MLEQKWSPELIEAGWTVLPAALIEHQRALGIDAIDINIILHLANRWWTADNRPMPSKNSIAEAMNIDPSTVRRRIQAMEKAGFIKREERRVSKVGSKTNIYHLDGLIEHLKPFAADMVKVKKERMAEREARFSKRGKPKLALVKNDDDII